MDEGVVHRSARALIGWVTPQEAITLWLGRTPIASDDTTELSERAARYRSAVSARPAYQAVDAVVDVHSFGGLLEPVADRPAVQATFHGLVWRPAVVDLTRVLSFQKLVFADRPGTAEAIRDEGDLLEICLPAEQPAPPEGAINDADGKGFTISSLNTNLRIAGGQLSEVMVSPGPGQPAVRMQAVTMLVTMGASYLQVVRYKGRCLLRDGYHRATTLLRAGLRAAPCILIEARTFQEIQPPASAFSYEVLFGERPPSLSDFWVDEVAADVEQLATRKVIRVRGDEFRVPR